MRYLIYVFFDNIGEMGLLQGVYFSRHIIRSVIGGYRARCLEQNTAVVVNFIYQMNGDPAFFFLCGYYRFMYVVPVHSFPSVFGEQGRMDVYYTVRVFADENGRDFEKVPREYDKVNFVFFKDL